MSAPGMKASNWRLQEPPWWTLWGFHGDADKLADSKLCSCWRDALQSNLFLPVVLECRDMCSSYEYLGCPMLCNSVEPPIPSPVPLWAPCCDCLGAFFKLLFRVEYCFLFFTECCLTSSFYWKALEVVYYRLAMFTMLVVGYFVPCHPLSNCALLRCRLLVISALQKQFSVSWKQTLE